MLADELQKLFRERLHLRLEPEMSEYVLGRWDPASPRFTPESLPVMGADARTGLPLLCRVNRRSLLGAEEQASDDH